MKRLSATFLGITMAAFLSAQAFSECDPDNTAPVISGVPADVTLECANGIPTPLVTSTDECDPSPKMSFGLQFIDGGPNTIIVKRTWTATDASGNRSVATQLVTVLDETDPEITCPPDTSVSCPPDFDPSNTGSASAVDNCDAAPGVAYTDSLVIPAQNADHPMPCRVERTWTTVDACGNEASCLQTINILDLTPPVIVCPPDATYECPADTSVAANGTATATDACMLGDPVISSTDEVTDLCGGTETVVRTWASVDACGNVSTCDQTIMVVDTTGPAITCPDDVTVNCEDDRTSASTGTATATDTCDDGELAIAESDSVAAGSCPQEEVITRTWTATDDCGNASSCDQIVAVVDDEAPAIACPGDITVNCEDDRSSANTGVATATDNCDDDVTITESDSVAAGSCIGLGVDQENDPDAEATFDCGGINLSLFQSFTPSTHSLAAVDLRCRFGGGFPANGATATVNIREGSPTGAVLGTATAFVATAAAGSSSQLRFEFPQLAVNPGDLYVIEWAFGQQSSMVWSWFQSDGNPYPGGNAFGCTGNSNDETDMNFITYSDPSAILLAGAIRLGGDEEVITRTWTATDDCGNASSCVQTVTVVDDEAPVITCPADVTVDCEDDRSSASTGVATATDNCDGNVDIVESDSVAAGSCPQEEVITRTWTATDNCGNASSCDQVVAVVDDENPAITCPDDVTVDCEDDRSSANTGVATATDNCDDDVAITESDSVAAGSCPQEEVITRTWTATDDCGNASSCDQIVTVVDDENPAITCPADVTVNCEDDRSSANTGVATASDNCDGEPDIVESDSVAAGSCLSVIDWIPRISLWCGKVNQHNENGTWMTDPDGTSGCFYSYKKLEYCQKFWPDTTSVYLLPDKETITFYNAGNQGSFPNTKPVYQCVGANGIGQYQSDEEVITRTWTATDDCGNASSCVQIVTVVDDEPPVITCPDDVTVNCEDDRTSASTGVAPATDNCDSNVDITESDSVAAGTCPQEEVITRTWTGTDNCGNASSCDQTVAVVDDESPEITCPADMTVN